MDDPLVTSTVVIENLSWSLGELLAGVEGYGHIREPPDVAIAPVPLLLSRRREHVDSEVELVPAG